MKNFKLLLVAAVVFGAGSAFTTSIAPGEFVNSPSLGWTPKDTAPGRCEEQQNALCTYVQSGASYVPLNTDEDAIYIE